MAKSNSCCYRVRGSLYMQELVNFCPTIANPNPNALIEVGNASVFQIDITENEISQIDFRQKTSVKSCVDKSVDEISLAFTLHCLDQANFARAFFGEVAEDLAATAIVDEQHVVNAACEFVPFFKTADTAIAVVVSDGTTTFVEGTDYTVSPNGILLTDATTITFPSTLLISYTTKSQFTVDMFKNNSRRYRIVLDGCNTHDGEPVYVEFYNVQLSPAASFNFLSPEDAFSSIEMTATVLADPCNKDAQGIDSIAKLRGCVEV